MTEQVLPQITLTAAGADLAPEAVLAHALETYRTSVAAGMEARILAAPMDLSVDMLKAIVLEVASGHLNPFRIAAGVAIRLAAEQAAARRQVSLDRVAAAKAADDAAMNLGSYLASTSGDAVVDGFHLGVNAKVPPKEVARRAARGFGLTAAQMRTGLRLKDEGKATSIPGSWRSLFDKFVRRAFGQRVGAVVVNTLRQIEHDTVQRGWEEMLESGAIPETAVKVWYTAEDERTCPVCAPMDRTAVPVMDRFELPDGNRVRMPPVHPNCRCTVELAWDEDEIPTDEGDEEVAKAWGPEEAKLHPRSAATGRFSTKTKEHEALRVTTPRTDTLAAARLNVDRMLAESGLGSRSGALSQQAVAAAAQPTSTLAGQRLASSGLAAGKLAAGSLASTPGEVVSGQLRDSIVLGNSQISLRSLNMERQMQIAAVIAGNAKHQNRPRRGGTSPLPDDYVAFASELDLNVQQYLRGQDRAGFAQVNKPLRFVSRHDRAAVRGALDDALAETDKYLRETDLDMSLANMAIDGDPGVQEAARDMQVAILASRRQPQGEITVSPRVEDVQEAWRHILAPSGGFRGAYTLDAYDSTGTTVGSLRVSASILAAMSAPHAEYLPRVVVAPFGTWNTESTLGATTQEHGTNAWDVTGAYSWTSEQNVIILDPDSSAYRRANPEYPSGT